MLVFLILILKTVWGALGHVMKHVCIIAMVHVEEIARDHVSWLVLIIVKMFVAEIVWEAVLVPAIIHVQVHRIVFVTARIVIVLAKILVKQGVRQDVQRAVKAHVKMAVKKHVQRAVETHAKVDVKQDVILHVKRHVIIHAVEDVEDLIICGSTSFYFYARHQHIHVNSSQSYKR